MATLANRLARLEGETPDEMVVGRVLGEACRRRPAR